MSSRSPSLHTNARTGSCPQHCARSHTSSVPASAVDARLTGPCAGVRCCATLARKAAGGRLRAAARTGWLWLALSGACSATPAANAPDPSAEIGADAAESAHSEPLEFSFPGIDQLAVTSASTRGRVTVLAFVTTYDMASQLVLRRLGDVLVRFTPRANAAAVVIEPPLYSDLLPAYSASLQLPFPVVMADFATLQGQGPFASIQRVPTLVVLDRAGREVTRRQGSLSASEIEDELTRASRARR